MKFFIALLLVSVAAAQNNFASNGGGQRSGGHANAPRPNQSGRSFNPAPAPAPAINPLKAVNPFNNHFRARVNPASLYPSLFRSGATNDYVGQPVYGMGLNNPRAAYHNIAEMNRALAIVKANPSILIRVNRDGEIELTDKFGEEAELYNVYGQELNDFVEY